MKRNIIVLFILGVFTILGCEKIKVGDDFLEKAPGVDVTKDTIFKSMEFAERLLNGAYRSLPYGINTSETSAKGAKMSHDLLEDLTDLSQTYLNWGGVFTLYYSGQYNAATENSSNNTKYHLTSEGSFKGIRDSYLFIENVDRVPDGTPELKRKLKAEARMIIAIHYSDMYRHYGGMPWINHAYSISEDFSSLPRLTSRATCDSIIALIDKAAADLPWALSNVAEDDGRFTKASAMGLKARMLLFDASPLFNYATPYLSGEASTQKLTWHGSYDPNLWKKAADAAKALITQVESTSEYKLLKRTTSTYRQDFQDAYYTRGNGEVLISVRDRFRSPSGPSWDYPFYWSSGGWGSGSVTQEYVDMFPMANGLPITNALSGYNPNNPYLNRDPRLYETVLVNGDTYKGRTAELWIGGRERPTQSGTQAAAGYLLRKFILEGNTATSYSSIIHWPYLRLAEIYLTYAEAQNEFNNGPDAEAYRCVNLVRGRVGLGALPAGLNRDQFREAILTERACEFGWEEVRWFDLIRWKREADFKKRLHGMNVTRSATAPYTYTYSLFECPPRYWMQSWSPKWYLSAFPTNEVNKGYGLVQNPGW